MSWKRSSGIRSCAAVVLGAAFMIPALAAGARADVVFRCAGSDGVTVYSDHQCGPNATRVELPPPAAEIQVPPPPVTPAPSAPAGGSNGGVHINLSNSNVLKAPSGGTRAVPGQGDLPFDVYRRLDNGMSEGRVLAIAGPPARVAVDSVNTYEGIQRKSYYYVNHGYNASITHIQFVNGRVVRIDRDPLLGN